MYKSYLLIYRDFDEPKIWFLIGQRDVTER